MDPPAGEQPHEMDEAEALCGQVVVMRAGRVIDAGRRGPGGTPREHGDDPVQHAGSARAAAGPPPPARRGADVERAGAQVTVRGHRRVIGYVGAALVRWEPVPADLSVHVPSLEDALLGLLNGEPASMAVAKELVEGRR